MIDFIMLALSSYALTFLIVESDILHALRQNIIHATPMLRIRQLHFLECRMCVGFWVSLFITLIFINITMLDGFVLTWLSSYGASYFLATQEK